MGAFWLDPNARDLTPEVIDTNGLPKVMPAAFYADTTPDERSLLAWRHGLYLLPTHELVQRLRLLIDGRNAIEIGSGNGVLAKALGIQATDNRMQEWPDIRAHYQLKGQPTVRYGDNVEQLDAVEAVSKYKPQVIIASWVTHRYDPSRPELGGNMYGVDEELLLYGCEEYIFVGNERVHQVKPLLSRRHALEHPSHLYSRSDYKTRGFIGRWVGYAKR